MYVAQEYKEILIAKYTDNFMPPHYQYSCVVYQKYIDVWLADIKLAYSPSIYIPFMFERFPLKITMWYEDDYFNTCKKIWQTN